VSETNVPVTAPPASGVRLPATYEAAKQALSECTRVDECREWADKAAALRSYARQRDDPTLHNLAQRIQLRAIRRMGELSAELGIEQPRDESGRLASSGKTAKSAVLKDAGISTSAAHRAERIASIPDSDFEADLAADTPPTVTELAMRGTVSRPAESGPIPASPRKGRVATDMMRELAVFCATHDPASIAYSVADFDAFCGYAQTVTRWLNRCVAGVSREEVA
jgi:hypothetical protein